VKSKAWPNFSPTAVRTLTAAAVTSGPTPSPGSTAMRAFTRRIRTRLLVKHRVPRAPLLGVPQVGRRLLEALFFDETVSYTEIAVELGCSPNSIGPIRARCFKELRDALSRG